MTMTKCLGSAIALAILLLSCADARTLQQTPSPPTTYTGNQFCTVGSAGNAYCQNGTTNPQDCVPLKYAFPNGGYNDTAGACANALKYTYDYTFKSFTYNPPDKSWQSATQKAFIGTQRCNDQSRNSGQACQMTYNRQTTTSTSTTFTQSLALEADFTFKVGGCALCPAEADTTFKVTANVGFQENFSNSSTTGFSASLTSNPPPGNCTVGVFSVSYLNDFTAQFEADVDATCKETISFNSVAPYYTIPCVDVASDLKNNKAFTGTVKSIDPGYGFDKVAHLSLSGTQTVSFGTAVNSDVCDCADTECINKAEFNGASGQTNAANVNSATLPSGVSASQIGASQPLTNDQKTCDNCTSIAAAPAPGSSKSG